MNLWFGISIVLMIIGIGSWIGFGPNLGIDFKGGGQFSYSIPAAKRPTSGNDTSLIEKAREALEKGGVEKSRLQVEGGQTLVINTDALPSQLSGQSRLISASLKDVLGEEPKLIGQQSVGPIMGEELRNNAIQGVIIGIICIAGWIYIRYNFAGEGLRYAVSGILALLHDVVVLVGVFALIGHFDPRIEVDGSFIAALLTVVGYSINDSVVIFDRIRENLRLRRKDNYLKVINDSLLETMSRSINTGMTVVIMLLVLLFLGGESMYNFVLAMLIGIVSGLYSSIFNASMVLVAWHKFDEKKLASVRAARAGGASERTTAAATPRPGATRSTSASLPATGAPRQTFATRSGSTATAASTSAVREEGEEPAGESEAKPKAPAPAATPVDPSRTYTGPRKARTKRRF